MDDIIKTYILNKDVTLIIDDFDLISNPKIGSIIEAFVIKAKLLFKKVKFVLFVNIIHEIQRLSDWIENCQIIRYIFLFLMIQILCLSIYIIKVNQNLNPNAY